MEIEIELKERLQKYLESVLEQKRACLFENCNEQAIGSHILQKKGILNGIVENGHFYAVKIQTLFHATQERKFTVEEIGIKKGYKFNGFCNIHDFNVFRPIETHPIDFTNRRNLALFNYRTLCVELRRKQILYETQIKIPSIRRELGLGYYLPILHSVELGIADLQYFKEEAEEELRNEDVENFEYKFLRLPEKKLCFSATISVDDENREEEDFDIYGNSIHKPWPTSTLNYFPYAQESLFILATHKKHKCSWSEGLFENLKTSNNKDKILSDLLTYRLEVWGMSPTLYNSISKDKFEIFLDEAHRTAENFAPEIISGFNLFS